MKPTLVLLPNVLGDQNIDDALPKTIFEVIDTLDGMVAESHREAIRYLCKFLDKDRANSLPLEILNEHTTKDEINSIFETIAKDNKRWGIISDCGLPCIADPGTSLVMMANRRNIKVEVVPGPSSIIIALMLSGMSGQSFAFNGYLPRKYDEMKKQITMMEKRAYMEMSTQMWMDAPYRSCKMISDVINILRPQTLLCVAADVTLSSQIVISKTVGQWRKDKSIDKFKKKPSIFLISKQLN
jgi:16S rRNA (cytidine1402-2'-O)-methyltransferase